MTPVLLSDFDHEYDVNDIVDVVGQFYDPPPIDTPTAPLNAIDPGLVICTVRDPHGNISTPAVSGMGTAPRVASFIVTTWGVWNVAMDSAGQHQAAEEASLRVRRPKVPR